MGDIVDSNEELRKHAIPDHHFRNIEVTSKVMQDIEILHHKKIVVVTHSREEP